MKPSGGPRRGGAERVISRRAWVLAAAAGGLLACGARRATVTPRPPLRRVPADLVPGDLDVVVRVDLGAVRTALGSRMTDDLVAPLPASGDPGLRELVATATAGATTGWLAFRPGPAPSVLDHVLVLRGRFPGLDPRDGGGPPGWEPPRELGGGWRRHDAAGPVERSAPARIYLRDSTVVALVTTAELDAVERTLERGIAPETRLGPLLPPTHGTLAARARSRSIAAWLEPVHPTVAALLRAAQRLSIVVDLEDDRLRGEAELTFGDPASPEPPAIAAATETANHLERLRQALTTATGPIAAVARGVDVEAEGGSVRCRVDLERGVLGPLLGQRPGAAAEPLAPP